MHTKSMRDWRERADKPLRYHDQTDRAVTWAYCVLVAYVFFCLGAWL